MRKRVALVSAVVVAALVAAVFGATAALSLIGVGAFGPGGKPLSETDVRRSLAAHPTTPSPAPTPGTKSSSPAGSGNTGHSPAAKVSAFTSTGGTVFASCAGAQATLARWIPSSGYSTDGYGQGPASSVWVKFKSGSSEQTVSVNCVAGRPHLITSADDHGGGAGGGGGDDHGHGGDDGGGGHGGGSGGGGSGGGGGGRSGGK